MAKRFRWHETAPSAGGSTSRARPQGAAKPAQRPSYVFVTLDPGLRVERREDHARRARIDGVLRTIDDPVRREAYLATVRGRKRATAA